MGDQDSPFEYIEIDQYTFIDRYILHSYPEQKATTKRSTSKGLILVFVILI